MSDLSILLKYLIAEYIEYIEEGNIEREIKERTKRHIWCFEDWALAKLKGEI